MPFPLSASPEGVTTVGPEWLMVGPLPTGPSGDGGGCKVTASKGSVPSTPSEQLWDPPPMGTALMRAPGIGGHPWVHLEAPWEQGPWGDVPARVYFPVHFHQPPKISRPDAPDPRERYFIHLSQVPPERSSSEATSRKTPQQFIVKMLKPAAKLIESHSEWPKISRPEPNTNTDAPLTPPSTTPPFL